MGDSPQEGSALSGRGHYILSPAGIMETVGLAPQGAQYLEAGLSAGVVETILNSRAPSMRRLYGLKWNVFTYWCREHASADQDKLQML